MDEQEIYWNSQGGRKYLKRKNCQDINQIWKNLFGKTRSVINKTFLKGTGIGKHDSILEIGSGQGLQLSLLKQMGYKDLWGIDTYTKALEKGRKREPMLNLLESSADELPFKDNTFDVVMTSGLLIHLNPKTTLLKAMDEIIRVTRRHIWCYEYYSPKCQEIKYQGEKNLLWKNDFATTFIKRQPKNLILKKHIFLPYKKQNQKDVMFLLQKRIFDYEEGYSV